MKYRDKNKELSFLITLKRLSPTQPCNVMWKKPNVGVRAKSAAKARLFI